MTPCKYKGCELKVWGGSGYCRGHYAGINAGLPQSKEPIARLAVELADKANRKRL